MNLLARIFGCILILALSSCAVQQKFIPLNPDTKQCLMMCEQRFESCSQICTDNCKMCTKKAYHSAAMNYLGYAHEKKIEGEIIARELNSYRDPLQCRKTTCECPTDYRTCIQTCSGKMPKRLQVAPAC